MIGGCEGVGLGEGGKNKVIGGEGRGGVREGESKGGSGATV